MTKITDLSTVTSFTYDPISFTTTTVKDFSSFQNNTDDKYFILNKKYLDKLYKSIEIGGYQFIKKLYSVDPTYCIDLITRKLNQTSYSVYELSTHEYILTRKEAVDTYNSLLELIQAKSYDTRYESINNDKAILELLNLDSSTSLGIYLKVDFRSEQLHVYESSIKESATKDQLNANDDLSLSLSVPSKSDIDKNKYLVLDRVGTFSMTDPATITYLKDTIDSKYNSATKVELPDKNLTWSELKKLCKVYKIDKSIFFTEEVNDILANKGIDQSVNASSTTIEEFAKVLYSHLDSINNLEYFYDRVIKSNFYYLK